MPTSVTACLAVLMTVPVGLVSGCAAQLQPGAATPPASPRSTSPPPGFGKGTTQAQCPPIAPGAGYADVDYIDFVQANGTQYMADLRGTVKGGPVGVSPADIGAEQFKVKCSFSQLNQQTQRMTPRATNGDAAFLTPGTPVYSIKGWSPNCRLAARRDGQWHVYLAYQQGKMLATPKPCAAPTVQRHQTNLHLWVSNQSFEDNPVVLTVKVDGTEVVAQAFDVGNQHNWVSFPIRLSPGPHVLNVVSGTGAEMQKQFTSPDEGDMYAVVDYWNYLDAAGRHLSWRTQSSPMFFD